MIREIVCDKIVFLISYCFIIFFLSMLLNDKKNIAEYA